MELSRTPDFVIGRMRVQPAQRTVVADGASFVLQRRVMQVLVAMADPLGQVVSQSDLIARCWSGLQVTDDAVGRCIGQLRRLAANWPDPPFEIETLAGVGYRLWAPEPAVPEAPTAGPGPRRAMPWGRLAGLAVLLAAIAGGVWAWSNARSNDAEQSQAVSIVALEAGSPQAEPLAKAISDTLVGALGVNQVAAVLTRGSSPTEGAQAGLQLRGAVIEEGQSVRVTLRLEDARTRVAVWSSDFRADPAHRNGLPDEVAAKAVDMIEVAQFARLDAAIRRDPAALSEALAAHDLIRWDRRHSWGRLLDVTQKLAARQPRFAFGHALAATADSYAIRWGAPAAQWPALRAEGRREAERALALDPQDAAAYYALDGLEPSYQAREAALLRGLKIATRPAAPMGALYNSEGLVLVAVGRLHEALPYVQRGVGLDPLSAVKVVNLIQVYDLNGQTGAAEELLAQSLNRWPDHPEIRWARLEHLTFFGRPQDASALLRSLGQLPPDLTPQGIAAWRQYLAALVSPDPKAERSIVAAAEAGALQRTAAALMLARLGDLDTAFDQARLAIADPKSGPRVLYAPAAAPLRNDPRFLALAQTAGVLDYWRAAHRSPDFCQVAAPPAVCASLGAASGR